MDWHITGRLMQVQPEVYRVAGSPETYEQRCWAALLAAGEEAALSHRAAAYWWEMWTGGEPPIEVVVPRGCTPDLRGVVVHQTRDPIIVNAHRRGLRVTSPMRTLLDLGAVVQPYQVEAAYDRGRALGLYKPLAVEWELVRYARKGRRGVTALRWVLDRDALGPRPPDGLLEPRFARLRVRFGLPQPVFQHRLGRYLVDFAYPDLKIAIEVDGYEVHGRKKAFEEDRARQNELVLLGWTVLRFTWTDVVKHPERVAQVVADAIGRAQAGMPA